MKKALLIISVVLLGVAMSSPTQAALVDDLKGRILLQVEKNGEAWYNNPETGKMQFLGRPVDALNLMKEIGLGITDADLDKLKGEGVHMQGNQDENLSRQLSGKVLLQVEQNGEAWYIWPENNERYFLGKPEDALRIFRELGLGVSEANFDTLPKSDEYIESEENLAFAEDLVGVKKFGVETKVRDSERINHIKQIQTALELYYADFGAYPVVADPGIILGVGSAESLSARGFTDAENTEEIVYFRTVPGEVLYGFDGYRYSSDGQEYRLTFQLEDTVSHLSGYVVATPYGIDNDELRGEVMNETSSETLNALDAGRLAIEEREDITIANFNVSSPMSTEGYGYVGKGNYYLGPHTGLMTVSEYLESLEYLYMNRELVSEEIIAEMLKIHTALELFHDEFGGYPLSSELGDQIGKSVGRTLITNPRGFWGEVGDTEIYHQINLFEVEDIPYVYLCPDGSNYSLWFNVYADIDDYDEGEYFLTPEGIISA